MKSFNINLTNEETNAIKDILSQDLKHLCLDDCIKSAYKSILSGETDTGFSFDLDFDPVGLEIIQNLLVYTDRIWYMAEEETEASGMFHFAMQMMSAYTGKTENDF